MPKDTASFAGGEPAAIIDLTKLPGQPEVLSKELLNNFWTSGDHLTDRRDVLRAFRADQPVVVQLPSSVVCVEQDGLMALLGWFEDKLLEAPKAFRTCLRAEGGCATGEAVSDFGRALDALYGAEPQGAKVEGYTAALPAE